jgi:hypothetical protein
MKPSSIAVLVLLGALAACAGTRNDQVLGGGEAALKLRSAQTRAFDTPDRNRVMRGIVATLQDLGFMVTGADAALGSVTGRKFTTGSGKVYDLHMTVTVRPREPGQTLVRANAEFNNQPVEDPQAYQNFFAALGRSLFLAGSQAE